MIRGRTRIFASLITIVIVALVLGVAPAVSHAYSSPKLYAAPIHEGGGAGRYFTGSLSDAMTCDACHGGGEPLELEVSGLPGGSWFPGATYTIDIAWAPGIEHAGIVAELTDRSGLAVGELSLPDAERLTKSERCASGTRAAAAFELEEGRRVMGIGDCGAHRLRMLWRTPDTFETGADTVWLHVASVRGDGSGDADGDGPSFEVHQLEPMGPTAEGCQIGAIHHEYFMWFILFMLFGTGLIRSQRRLRSATTIVLGVSLICASGCARVQPWERGRLAQPDMLIDIGGDLLVGSQHAVEYREGSAGAVGGAGGGCGCN